MNRYFHNAMSYTAKSPNRKAQMPSTQSTPNLPTISTVQFHESRSIENKAILYKISIEMLTDSTKTMGINSPDFDMNKTGADTNNQCPGTFSDEISAA